MKYGNQWRLTRVGETQAIATHSDRDSLVHLANRMAHDGGLVVYVYNASGHLESMRTFLQASDTQHGHSHSA